MSNGSIALPAGSSAPLYLDLTITKAIVVALGAGNVATIDFASPWPSGAVLAGASETIRLYFSAGGSNETLTFELFPRGTTDLSVWTGDAAVDAAAKKHQGATSGIGMPIGDTTAQILLTSLDSNQDPDPFTNWTVEPDASIAFRVYYWIIP